MLMGCIIKRNGREVRTAIKCGCDGKTERKLFVFINGYMVEWMVEV